MYSFVLLATLQLLNWSDLDTIQLDGSNRSVEVKGFVYPSCDNRWYMGPHCQKKCCCHGKVEDDRQIHLINPPKNLQANKVYTLRGELKQVTKDGKRVWQLQKISQGQGSFGNEKLLGFVFMTGVFSLSLYLLTMRPKPRYKM